MKRLAKLSLIASVALTTTLSALDEPVKNPVIPIKGNAWQLFGFNQPIDLKASFSGTPVKIIWAWDNKKEAWEAYSPQYAINMALENAYPNVKSLKPNQGFWVMSYEDTEVEMKEFILPLFEMCVDVNSPKYWENTTDETGANLTVPFPECDEYVNNLPEFEVIGSQVHFDGTTVTGDFVTNLPIVYLENKINGTTVPLKDVIPEDAIEYIVTNPAVELTNVNIHINPDKNGEGAVIDYSFEPSDANFSTIEMGFGLSSNLNEIFNASIQLLENDNDNNSDTTDDSDDSDSTDSEDDNTTEE